MSIQKDKFQEYLYHPEAFKTADLAELEQLIKVFPWFSTAAIILLKSSKAQSDPDFDLRLKSLSISIPNRKFIQKTLYTQIESTLPEPEEKEISIAAKEINPRITGISEAWDDLTQEKEKAAINGLLDSMKDDTLLEFVYTPKNKDAYNNEPSVSDDEKTGEIITENFEELKINERQSFDHWISKLGGETEGPKTPIKKLEIIESFIHTDPGVIRADKETSLEGDIAKNSAEENEGFITDTLARIYLKQGLYNKAIYAYEKLCLKYPEKSIYFVSQIEEIRSLYIKK